MNTYLVIKTLHIISATLMVGTGFGSAFYLFWANRSGSVAAQSVVSKWVIKADWWFTTPAVIFQPLSGLWMLHQLGMPFSWDGAWLWVKWTLALYVCWQERAGCLWCGCKSKWRKQQCWRINRAQTSCPKVIVNNSFGGNYWVILLFVQRLFYIF